MSLSPVGWSSTKHTSLGFRDKERGCLGLNGKTAPETLTASLRGLRGPVIRCSCCRFTCDAR